MAMVQKPTSRTRHMDIKYEVLCKWVERNLLHLKWIDTTVNLADLFTKNLSPTLFYHHTDFVLGRYPPHYCNIGAAYHKTPTPQACHCLQTFLVHHANLWTSVAHDPFTFRLHALPSMGSSNPSVPPLDDPMIIRT